MQQFEMSSCDLIILIILIKAVFSAHVYLCACVQQVQRHFHFCHVVHVHDAFYMKLQSMINKRRFMRGYCTFIIFTQMRKIQVQLSYCIISEALTVQAEQQLISASTPYSSTYTHCTDCTDIFYSRTALICVLIGRCVRRLISSFELDVSGGNLWWTLCFVIP